MFDWMLPETHAVAILKKDDDTVKGLFEEFERRVIRRKKYSSRCSGRCGERPSRGFRRGAEWHRHPLRRQRS
jgi:hypothetical protein